MDRITRAAKASYENLPQEEKSYKEEIFKSLDKDGDGQISIQGFRTYFERNGEHAKVNSNIFDLIDRNGDGKLGFEEVLTLFYISESGRPVCDGCGNFIQALFFTCTYCHYDKPGEDGYNICIACYETGGFKHEHTEFLDNFTFFVEKKKNIGAISTRIQANFSYPFPSGSSLLSRKINPQRTRRKDMFKRGFQAITKI